MKTVQYLEAVKAVLKVESDYELAKRLKVSKQRISSYRTGRSTFDNEMAVTVAEILDTHRDKVIADMELERGSTSEMWRTAAAELTLDLSPEVWARVRKLATVAAVAIGASVSAPPSAQAAPSSAAPHVGGLCIMLSTTSGSMPEESPAPPS